MNNTKRKMPAVGKCFDHLGGILAPILFKRLIEMEWIRLKEGKKTVFEVTENGMKGFKKEYQVSSNKYQVKNLGTWHMILATS